MKCRKCGTRLREGASFCPKCGSEVMSAQKEPSTGNNSNRALTIAIVSAIALVIIVIAVLCVRKGINREIGSTASDEAAVQVEHVAIEDEDASDVAEPESAVEVATDEEEDLAVSYDALAEAYVQEIGDIKEESIKLIKE